MDIYEYLEFDHKKVDQLFKQFEESTIKIRQQQIVALIIRELLVHAHSEQETFYKFLAQFPETKELSLHGVEEHKEIEELIAAIQNAKSPKGYNEAVKHLKETVTHHVKEEEGKMFRQAKKVISANEAIILKEKMHYLKGKFLVWLDEQAEKEKKVAKKIKKANNIPATIHSSKSTKRPSPLH